jgi:hypothetical protein
MEIQKRKPRRQRVSYPAREPTQLENDSGTSIWCLRVVTTGSAFTILFAMKCPHCLVDFNEEQTWWSVAVGRDVDGEWILNRKRCPTCDHFILVFETGPPHQGIAEGLVRARLTNVSNTRRAWPKGIARAPVPPEVPPEIATDYKEACLVLVDSPKASAALSRRCLQNLLRSAAGVKPGDLADEIQQVIDSGKLISTIADSIDAVRVIGNFAAHPIKSKATSQIVDVEPHEAEWNLGVLESLFDFYYVLPARERARRDALNKKLQEMGKPPLK